MPQGVRQTAIALAFLAGGAQAQHALHCRDLDPTAPEDAYRAFECVSKLNTDLEQATARIDALEDNLQRIDRLLKRVQPVPAVGDHDATRAIVAYYSDKGEKRCPEGWSPYEPAKDRFILGAGGSIPTVGGVGGAAEVTLTIEQMPRHAHEVLWRDQHSVSLNNATSDLPGDNQYRLDWFNEQNRGNAGDNMSATWTGGDKPHTNMPPYIALYFCKKD